MEEIILIKPQKGLPSINLKEIIKYRELFFTLALRDIKVRYKQTIFGGLWAVAQPLATMIVFSFFFGSLAQISSDGLPYPIFSYSGLILWMFFLNSVSLASSSLLNDARLVTKIYFPKLILPLSTTLVCLIDYVIAFFVLVILALFFKIVPNTYIFFLPIIIFFTWLLSSGLGLFFAAVNIKYRDVKFVIPFFFQLLMFASPIIYPTSVSGRFKWLIMLNPISGFIEAHRAIILGHQQINFQMLVISIIFSIIIFIGGAIYFRSLEKRFADII